ncbi:caspase family protein [Acaryochloris sp. CCMEE 5410]|uniref:caspase family protein n=1 Tax=Acaryochloris sp. CCMEE 5410 TaxID=310037 RepID=UPI00024849FC|nr:caspase family protein [Acaryochloris sp. CCMEE 5410]KAI9133342.1 caspase family protein [Acaryochloris sp. CCMEE 5410]
MALTRRALLRKTSLVLAGLGLSDLSVWKFANQYQQVLAQPTSRKLALLVGINQYRDLGKQAKLKGCLTDLELQRELLVHRFGFHPDDIVILKNKQATYKNIETAFTTHLIEQSRPQDCVIFHFSGYGCLLSPYIDTALEAKTPLPSQVLLPFDSDIQPSDHSQALENVLLQEQLALWFRSLNTQQSLCVLDAGFTYPGKALLGNLRVRSQPSIQQKTDLPDDREQQEKLLNQSQRRQSPSELILWASQQAQTAVEAQWHDFSSGLFTYALTQHLWQSSPTKKFSASFNRIVSDVERQVGRVQQPSLSGQSGSSVFAGLALGGNADGVVTDVEDNGEEVTVWLGGVLPQIVEYYATTTCFKVTSKEGSLSSSPAVAASSAGSESEPNPVPQEPLIQLESSRGCVGTGRCEQEGQINSGQKIRESFRVISRSINLNVALGSQLNRIERVDATSAFSDMPNINPVIAGTQNADVLFTQASSSSQVIVNSVPTDLSEEEEDPPAPPPQTQYGLFSQGGEELADTRGESGEAIKTAVNQLHDTLKLLLARKTLDLTVNDFSSRVGAVVALESTDDEKPQILAQQFTARAPWLRKENSSLSSFEKQGQVVQIAKGQHIQYRVYNYSDAPLYWLVLGVDTRTQFFSIYAPEALLLDTSTNQDAIASKDSLTVPFPTNEYVVRGPEGIATTYIILSRNPFEKGLEAIASKIRQSSSNTSPVVARLVNPLEVTQQVLQDLHNSSAPTAEKMGIASDSNWVWDVEQWATFQFTHEVI